MKAASLAHFVRRRGRAGFVVALVAAVAALCWWMGLFEPEPSYQGQTATVWLESVHNGRSWEGVTAATAAFRAMGPKGVRFLARTLEKRPVQLPASVEELIAKLGLPEWADPAQRIEYHAAHLGYRQEAAAGILHRLGNDAAPAIPILVRLFRHSKADESGGFADFMAPWADKLVFMVPELIRYLGQNKPGDIRTIEDIKLLAAIGPKAKDALPVLLKKSQSADPLAASAAAVALWNIARETNELSRILSNSLRSHDLSAQIVLRELERAAPLPKPLGPLLEKALRHPVPSVRRAAESLLDRVAPERLRQLEAELNRHQDELLQDHLKLLQSTNRLDCYNAARALQFFGPQAAAAAPRLVEILGSPAQPIDLQMDTVGDKLAAFWTLRSLGSNASVVTPALLGLLRSKKVPALEICDILGEIGPNAAEAIPTLRALLATNYDQASRWQIVPQVAQALALINPHDSNAIAVLREDQTLKHGGQALPRISSYGRERYFSATITQWKLGLETNLPMDELMDELIARADAWAFDRLGDIGPAAKKALPVIESKLKRRPWPLDAVLAIRQIAPEEAKRLGLPGLFIICPDKY